MSTALAFNRNGKLLASTGSDRVIQIWDVERRQIIQSLTGHTDYVLQLLFVDDRTLLSRSYDATLREWDLTTGEGRVLTLLERQWCMAFGGSPDCRYTAFGSDTPLLTILDRHTGAISSYAAVGNRLRTISYTHDARSIVAITDDRHLNLWDVGNNYRHSYWQIGDREATVILPHPHHPQLVAIATEDGNISLWDLHRQLRLNVIGAHGGEIRALKVIYHPTRLVSCGIDGSIKVWAFSNDTLMKTYAIDFEKPYRDLNITGVKGLNRSQLATLTQLGALSN
jgi:WD40 repeat protein